MPVKSSSNNTNTTPPRKPTETRPSLPLREPVSIPIERVGHVTNAQSIPDPDPVKAPEKVVNTIHIKTEPVRSTRDRRHRSRTLEAHQIQAVDNQIYGCPSKTKQAAQHRSESHKHRSNRLSLRRSSEDTQDKQLQLRRNNEYYSSSMHDASEETWFEIDKDHWTNLLENGWRPTIGTPGVTSVAIADPGINQ